MRRLIAQNFTYKLRTVGYWELINAQGDVWDCDCTNSMNFEYNEDCGAAVEEDSDINFVEYIHDEEIQNKLDSITLSYDYAEGELITTIQAKEELTQEDKDYIFKYMQGQFSDGWGEGFEQRPIVTDTWEDVEEEWDEEEQETYYMDVSVPVEVIVHWWGKNTTTVWA